MFRWLHTVNVKVYLGQRMTGAKQCVIYQRNAYCERVLRKYGITPYSPVTEEGVSPIKKKLDQPSQEQLHKFWQRDKQLIQQSHVLLDITGSTTSEGLKHEIGLARYFLFRPVVRILKLSGPSVALEEEDVVTNTVEDAAQVILERWGTPWKRLKWKGHLFRKCFLHYMWIRLRWFWDWI
jgi:hypothetical protein